MPVKKTLYALIIISICCVPVSAKATNGYWAHGYGTKSKALAGAGAALPLGGMDAASNPATMAYLDDRLDLGLAAFYPSRGFTADNNPQPGFASLSAGTTTSRNDTFIFPHIAKNWQLDEQTSVGASIGGNGGMNTQYDAAIFSSFNNGANIATSPTGIDFRQIFLGLTYSKKISPDHSFGITPILAGQTLKVTGLEPFKAYSLYPNEVTNKGYDYSHGAGIKIGWYSRLTDKFSLGLSYQSRMWMSRFNDYQGLFAEQGDFDIPPNLIAGIAYKITPKITLVADVQRIFYGDVKSVSNASDLVFTPGSIQLGTDGGLGFGWKDMTIGKFGLQWECLPDLTLRGGYSHGNQAIASNQVLFNTLAPAANKDHFTLGLTKILNNTELNVSFMYSPEDRVYGTNPNTGTQTMNLHMDQLEVECSLGFHF
jgi:long-chain fatty acid transport protein